MINSLLPKLWVDPTIKPPSLARRSKDLWGFGPAVLLLFRFSFDAYRRDLVIWHNIVLLNLTSFVKYKQVSLNLGKPSSVGLLAHEISIPVLNACLSSVGKYIWTFSY